ncbi:4-oxalocrotonate tautomerase family protein [Streptomyces sp. NPDC101234]|uniref:tautomerase family protein n=1 Tax=Streptomyces sp. NPDC101234 TaxID=3366138 RepID=UPI003801DEC3
MRVNVTTNAGALDREQQLGLVKELSELVASAAGDPSLAERTWVAPDRGGSRRLGHRRPRLHQRRVVPEPQDVMLVPLGTPGEGARTDPVAVSLQKPHRLLDPLPDRRPAAG